MKQYLISKSKKNYNSTRYGIKNIYALICYLMMKKIIIICQMIRTLTNRKLVTQLNQRPILWNKTLNNFFFESLPRFVIVENRAFVEKILHKKQEKYRCLLFLQYKEHTLLIYPYQLFNRIFYKMPCQKSSQSHRKTKKHWTNPFIHN